MKKDAVLQRHVLDELEWEPSVDAAEVGVTAHEGVITLKGAVKSYSEKLAAQRAAERVQGVRAIANDLEVQLPGMHERTDSDIALAAVDALAWRTSVPAGRVKLSVSKGWITLEGDVDWQFQKTAAFDAVHHLMGVRGVTNLIDVKPRVSATEVKSRIESALQRSGELESRKLRVETQGGRVTIHGDVRSWWERQEAERMAWSAPGVNHVENLIMVSP
jgi:osmotically-inducible protein OsmY